MASLALNRKLFYTNDRETAVCFYPIDKMVFKLIFTPYLLEADEMITSERLRVRKELNWMIYFFLCSQGSFDLFVRI